MDYGTFVRSETVITGGLSVGQRLRDINRQRRVRRMRRVVIAAASSAERYLATGGRRGFIAFATLTYRPGVKWEGGHIREYINATKAYATRNGFKFRYQWVIELTKKGVPHYHVLFWLPLGVRLPKPDRGGWTHGRSNIKRAKNPVGYLVKYATKGETGLYQVPKGARLFGVGGGSEFERLAAHRAGLPMWLLAFIPNLSRARKVPGAGWVAVDTGEVFSSPFVVSWFKDDWGVVVFKVVEIGVLYGLTSEDRRWDREQADHQWQGWGELPSDVADRDFIRGEVYLSAQLEIESGLSALRAWGVSD